MKLVSVIVSVYNVENYIAQTIYLLRLLPLSFDRGCSRLALKLTGISQQLHILRDRFTVKFA